MESEGLSPKNQEFELENERVISLEVEELLNEAEGNVCVYDTRERAEYIELLREFLPDFTFISQTLPVGDYIVNGIIIERKTVDDLLHSITDGRLNNQLYEMSRNTHLSVLTIIGDQTKIKYDPLNKSIFQSVKAGAWFKRSATGAQGIVIPLEFDDDEAFAFFLKGLAKKEKVRTLKLSKIKVTGNDLLVMTLAAVPGWNEVLARRGLEVFGTIEEIIQATPTELEDSIKGCGKKKAQDFHAHFRRRYNVERLGNVRSRKSVLRKHGKQKKLDEAIEE